MLPNTKYRKSTITLKEPEPPQRSVLSDLFKPLPDDQDEQDARDLRLGHVPRNTVKSSSFTI